MDESHSDAQGPAAEGEGAAGEARKRLAAYILGALTTGGSLGLLAWTAQAHGNRSSHTAVHTSRAAPDQPKPPTRGRGEPETAPAPEPVPPPDGYAMQRARVLAPNAASTKRLAELSELITGDAEEERRIQAERAALVKQILLGSVTGEVLQYLEADEVEKAWTRIENKGDDLQVLRTYRVIMTDLDYLSRKDGRSTPAHLPTIVRVAAAARRFATERAKTRETWETRSEYVRLLFDVAALTVPDDGAPAPEILVEGGRAADACLALAKELDSAPDIQRGHWIVGLHRLKAGLVEAALDAFRTSAEQAEALGREDEVAWSKAYLALAHLEAAGTVGDVMESKAHDTRAAALRAESLRLFERLGDGFASSYVRSMMPSE